MNILKHLLIGALVLVLLDSCSPARGDKPGHEFMPDMVHSTAYEANILNYYYYNTWGDEGDLRKYAIARKPVAGTVPRLPNGKEYGLRITGSGSVPYHYENTEEERTRAMTEIIQNPIPISASGLAKAKDLYNIYCGICHGDKADGNGYLVRDGAAYPAQPISLISDELIDASNGRYYHAIMYGKNLMGGYADKLSHEERWNVIHYIRSLQAKTRSLEYSEEVNTLNSTAIPCSMVAVKETNEEVHSESNDHDNDHEHEGDHSEH